MTSTTSSPDPLVARLRAAGCVYAEDEATLLREAAGSAVVLEDLVAQRVAGVPVEQLVGWAAFAGMRVAVAPGVFVPRRRSELLVRLAGDLLRRGGVLVELCCGTGAVAAAVAGRRADAVVVAADLDPVAVACARRNLPAGAVHEGDLYAALAQRWRGCVDVLVANAPYVPTGELGLMPREARDHEPRHALDGGADGLQVQRRIAAGAPQWLARGGVLVLETSRHQAAGTAAAVTAAGLVSEVVRCADLDATAVVARHGGR